MVDGFEISKIRVYVLRFDKPLDGDWIIYRAEIGTFGGTDQMTQLEAKTHDLHVVGGSVVIIPGSKDWMKIHSILANKGIIQGDSCGKSKK